MASPMYDYSDTEVISLGSDFSFVSCVSFDQCHLQPLNAGNVHEIVHENVHENVHDNVHDTDSISVSSDDSQQDANNSPEPLG